MKCRDDDCVGIKLLGMQLARKRKRGRQNRGTCGEGGHAIDNVGARQGEVHIHLIGIIVAL